MVAPETVKTDRGEEAESRTDHLRVQAGSMSDKWIFQRYEFPAKFVAAIAETQLGDR